ncbi:MAG: Rrf2 family transcriptional regulator [Candidatus Humimicrobiaceae bacterium]
MKLSTRGRYSTRLMMELAHHFGEGPVLLKDISRVQDISLKYLGQLIIPLKIAGLIKSTRGSHGGYFLSRPPEKINLSEVVNAVEGPIAFSECVDSPDICYRSKTCAAREVWEKATKQFNKTLGDITLAEMLDRQKAMSE